MISFSINQFFKLFNAYFASLLPWQLNLRLFLRFYLRCASVCLSVCLFFCHIRFIQKRLRLLSRNLARTCVLWISLHTASWHHFLLCLKGALYMQKECIHFFSRIWSCGMSNKRARLVCALESALGLVLRNHPIEKWQWCTCWASKFIPFGDLVK